MLFLRLIRKLWDEADLSSSLLQCIDGSLPIRRVAKGPARGGSRPISEERRALHACNNQIERAADR